MSKYKTTSLWVVSFLLMCFIAFFQRCTGPTYPVKGTVVIENNEIEYELSRTHEGDTPEFVKIYIPDNSITGTITSKKYPSYDQMISREMVRNGDTLVAVIPAQPPAGKVMYDIKLKDKNAQEYSLTEEPIVIRYKGFVPRFFLYPHIIAIFLAFGFAARAGLEGFFKRENTFKLTLIATISLFFGGILFGPIIQYYAFGAFWTGWPLGNDLTDNKTIISFIMWIIATWKLYKDPKNNIWAFIALIITIVVFLIPHSVLGSEIDYTKMDKIN